MWSKFLVAAGRQIRQQCFPEFFCLIVLATSMYLIACLVIYNNETVAGEDRKGQQMQTPSSPHPHKKIHTFQETRIKVEELKSLKKLRNDRESYIENQRKLLAEEMKAFRFVGEHRNGSLDELIPEKGGKPICNLIVTTWRSGSTFLGEIVNTHPGSYYHYEPFAHYDNYTQMDYANLGEESLNIIRDLFNCKYDNLICRNQQMDILVQPKALENLCAASLISRMCRLFPIQSMKTVRMRLKLAKSLLEDLKLDIRILLLVRDPRATMYSRTSLTNRWCLGIPSCISEQSLCEGLEEDFYTAVKLRTEYPHRFMALRFEDIAMNPEIAVKKVFKFFRLITINL